MIGIREPTKRAPDAAVLHFSASHPIREPGATADTTVAVMAEQLAHVRQRAETLGSSLRKGKVGEKQDVSAADGK